MDVWIAKNLQWVFSGIGVVALTIAGKGLYSLFKQKKKEKSDIMTVVDRSPTVQHGQTNVGHVLNINGPVSGNLMVGNASVNQHSVANAPTKTSTITAKQIFDDIHSAPPFQQDERGKYYEGLAIDWNCVFSTIVKREENDVIGIILQPKDADFLGCFCDATLSEYPDIKTLPSKAPVRVVGTLERVDAHYLKVKDAKLFFR